MCKFFSFISNGHGNILYFDAKLRKKIIGGYKNYEADSHTSIASHFEVQEDKFNKYEFNPITKYFEIDQLNNKDDSKQMKKWVNNLDFKTIIPELNIKECFHPFEQRII